MDIKKFKSLELGHINNMPVYYMGCKQIRKNFLMEKVMPLVKIKLKLSHHDIKT